MNAWRIARKDLTLLIRDRGALATLLVMPLVFITILGVSTGQMLGWRNENEELKLAVVDEDLTDLSKSLVDQLRSRDGLRVTDIASAAAARQMVQDGDQTSAVVISKEFSAKVDELRVHDVFNTDQGPFAGPLSDVGIDVVTAPSMTNADSLVDMIVRGVTLRTVLPVVVSRNKFLARFVRKAAEAAAVTPAKKPTPRTSGYGSVVYQKLVPAYTVLFTFFIVTIMARSFIAERELGTLRRLRTLPVRSSSLVLGKTIPFAVLSISQGAVLFLSGRILFGMSWGPTPWMLLPALAATSLAATGLGLLTATLVRTDAQVSSIGTLVVLTMAGISGCFMPCEWLPEGMRQLSLATPHAWALIAYDQLLSTTTPNSIRVWESCGALLAFGAGFLLLGWLRFRSET